MSYINKIEFLGDMLDKTLSTIYHDIRALKLQIVMYSGHYIPKPF